MDLILLTPCTGPNLGYFGVLAVLILVIQVLLTSVPNVSALRAVGPRRELLLAGEGPFDVKAVRLG
jgi:hypothetical protein